MRTTITIDDELLKAAEAISGITERNALLREGLKALIERESARRLARLGGSDAAAEAPLRRRPAAAPRRSKAR
ncbi:MAG: type II toxin-antitoxin system VapB family antitoxin [Casimicrobiaceae bacterium]